ncbi:TetR/AcrR family transcriptional regulator [Rapidithrix thailandica]|uniref:TetR/AcrR family transcriptional regulator n=1 Tax=Rapidithrix thailandica TaxID=413964 RepID=A0AAW9S9T5_9BACT
MDKKDLIVVAALELFVKKGFDATPTAAIAKAAGVSNGTLFHYFKTKEMLINSLYADTKERLSVVLMDTAQKGTSIKGKFRLLWEEMIVWSIDNPLKFHFFQQFSNSPYIDKLTKEEGQMRFEFVNQLLLEGQNAEVLKAAPLELLKSVAMATIVGTIQYFLEKPDAFKHPDIQEQAFLIFWTALKE